MIVIDEGMMLVRVFVIGLMNPMIKMASRFNYAASAYLNFAVAVFRASRSSRANGLTSTSLFARCA